MNIEEAAKLQLPCLIQRKAANLVVRLDRVKGNDGTGCVMSNPTGAYNIGYMCTSWNLSVFSLMDNNNLYGYVPQG